MAAIKVMMRAGSTMHASRIAKRRKKKGRVYIHALRDISRGEELFYDYGLVIEEKMSKSLKEAYACRCGATNCRGTMLAPVKKTPVKKAAKKKA